MALSRDQVGLIFRIDADAKPAINEMEKLKTSVSKSAKNTQAIVRETFETLSSEIIESFGIDGDIANSIANQLVIVRNAAFIIGAAVTGVTVALGVGLVLAASKAAELGSQINDLRQKTGLAAETISGLNVVAQQEGKTLDDLSGALIAFNKNIIDAQRGSKEFQNTFKQLGVEFRGNTDQALRQALTRIAGMRDGALKAAAAQRVFGESAADLVPILNNVKGGIDGAIEKAKELGLFFDNDGAAAAKQFTNQLKQLDLRFQGIAVTIGNVVLPTFSLLLGMFDRTIGKIGSLINSTSILGVKLSTILPLIVAGVGSAIVGLSPDATPAPPLPPELEDFKPTAIKDKKKKEDKLEEINLDKEIAQLQAKLQREELDRIILLNKLREQAEAQHGRALEQLERESAERTIAIIEREAEQRVITEEQAAEQIGAIRIAAFANRELQLKAEIESARNRLKGTLDEQTRAELLAEEQEFVDELELLQERRARIEEEAVDAVIEARRRDIESLIQFAEEQRRVRGEQLERQGFSPAVADAIAGMELLLGRTLTLWERNQIAAREYARTLEEDVTAALTKITDVQTLFKDAFGASIDAFINSAGSLKSAVQALKAALISPFIEAARTLAKFYAAKSIAAFADLDFRGGALYALASAGFAVLGALGTAAIGGGGGGRTTAPSSSFGGGASSQQQGPRIIEQGDRRRPEPQVIILRAEYQPGIIIQEMTRDYRNNGPSRQVLRRDILGEQPT